MNDIQNDIKFLFAVNSADVEALEDAKFTLATIKNADPKTYEEMIDESLSLIHKALSMNPMQTIEGIAERLGVDA